MWAPSTTVTSTEVSSVPSTPAAASYPSSPFPSSQPNHLQPNRSVQQHHDFPQEAPSSSNEGNADLGNGSTSFKPKISTYLESHPSVTISMDYFIMCLSVISCTLFVIETYEETWTQTVVVDSLELAISICFMIDYLVQLLVAQSPQKFIFSFQSFVDILTILPPMVGSIAVLTASLNSLKVLQKFNFLRFVRVLKLLRILRFQKDADSEISRHIFSTSLSVLSIVFCFAALFQEVELNLANPQEQDLQRRKWGLLGHKLQLHDAIYFTVVTVATVGYGDIHPVTIYGKFLVIVMIGTALVMVSRQVNSLLTLLASKSVYRRNFFAASGFKQHVLICGDVSYSVARDFLHEFFHPDHGSHHIHLVILAPHPPTSQLESLMFSPEYSYRVTYVEGSVTNDKDLFRASAHRAIRIFVLSNGSGKDAHSDDAAAILRAMSAKKFIAKQLGSKAARDIGVILMLRLPGNKRHYASENSMASHVDQLVCIDEIQPTLLAKSCLCPGFSTMIFNLVRSSGDDDDSINPQPWVKEYKQGASYEIYRAPLSRYFAGMKFAEVVKIVYEHLKITAFAIEVPSPKTGKYSVLLNPAEYLIPGAPARVYVYLIAGDKLEADQVSTFGSMRQGVSLLGGPLSPINALAMSWKNLGLTPKASAASMNSSSNNNNNNNNNNAGISNNSKGSKHSKSDRDEIGSMSGGEDDDDEHGAGYNYQYNNTVMNAIMSYHHAQGNNNNNNNNNNNSNGDVEMVATNHSNQQQHQPTNKFMSTFDIAPAAMVTGASALMETDVSHQSSPALTTQKSWGRGLVKNGDHVLNRVPSFASPKVNAAARRRLQNLANTYHISSELNDLEECTHPRVILEHHIVILGSTANLYFLVAPLRRRYLNRVIPIVVLHEKITAEAWASIAHFPEVYCVQGTMLDPGDLGRASIARADRVMILTNSSSNNVPDGEEGETMLADAFTIFAYNIVSKINPKAQIICQLAEKQNIAFIDPNNFVVEYSETAPFAAGTAYVSTLPTVLSCQAYYNSHLLMLLQELVLGSGGIAAEKLRLKHGASELFQERVPQAMVGKTYAEMFSYLVQQNMVPLGLYRTPTEEQRRKEAMTSAYVVTNGIADAVLTACDFVFVLSNVAPTFSTDVSFHGFTPKEIVSPGMRVEDSLKMLMKKVGQFKKEVIETRSAVESSLHTFRTDKLKTK